MRVKKENCKHMNVVIFSPRGENVHALFLSVYIVRSLLTLFDECCCKMMMHKNKLTNLVPFMTEEKFHTQLI